MPEHSVQSNDIGAKAGFLGESEFTKGHKASITLSKREATHLTQGRMQWLRGWYAAGAQIEMLKMLTFLQDS